MSARDHNSSTRSSRISQNILFGSVAGLCSRLCTAPLDLIRIRMQLGSTDAQLSFRNVIKMSINREGFKSLWKGNVASLNLWMLSTAVQFTFYDIFKQYYTLIFPIPSLKMISFASGASAGTLATMLTYPFDITRTQFAMQGNIRSFHSMKSFMTYLAYHHGINGIYTGIFPAILGVASYVGLKFTIYESCQESSIFKIGLLRYLGFGSIAQDALDNSLCGAIAGGVSKLIVYPLVTTPLTYTILITSLLAGHDQEASAGSST